MPRGRGRDNTQTGRWVLLVCVLAGPLVLYYDTASISHSLLRHRQHLRLWNSSWDFAFTMNVIDQTVNDTAMMAHRFSTLTGQQLMAHSGTDIAEGEILASTLITTIAPVNTAPSNANNDKNDNNERTGQPWTL